MNRIGQNIVKNSDCKVPFTIKVIDSDEINAMALPGGFFYVNSGLILNADEEAELAGVMAHETAHVCAHHAAREMTRMNYAQLGTIPLIMMTGYSWTGYGIYEAAQFAVPITFLKFSRDFEAQADYLGVQYMYRAGYDPQAFITFFEKIQALEKRKPGLVAKAFSDHPQTPDRILHSQEEIERILPAKDEYMVTTSEFDDVKARLARIENKRRLLEAKDTNKPSLRRASDQPAATATTGRRCSGAKTRRTKRQQSHSEAGTGGPEPVRPLLLRADFTCDTGLPDSNLDSGYPGTAGRCPWRCATLASIPTGFRNAFVMKKIAIFAAAFVFILLLTKIANQVPPGAASGNCVFTEGAEGRPVHTH